MCALELIKANSSWKCSCRFLPSVSLCWRRTNFFLKWTFSHTHTSLYVCPRVCIWNMNVRAHIASRRTFSAHTCIKYHAHTQAHSENVVSAFRSFIKFLFLYFYFYIFIFISWPKILNQYHFVYFSLNFVFVFLKNDWNWTFQSLCAISLWVWA